MKGNNNHLSLGATACKGRVRFESRKWYQSTGYTAKEFGQPSANKTEVNCNGNFYLQP